LNKHSYPRPHVPEPALPPSSYNLPSTALMNRGNERCCLCLPAMPADPVRAKVVLRRRIILFVIVLAVIGFIPAGIASGVLVLGIMALIVVVVSILVVAVLCCCDCLSNPLWNWLSAAHIAAQNESAV
jgi:hypothetical protein